MKRKPATAGAKYETFDAIPAGSVHVGNDLYKGAHVRQYMSKLRTKVRGPSGEVLYFVCPKIKGTKVWRAFVAWRPKEGEHYDQFVDVGMLRLENSPPPARKSFDVTDPDLDAPDGAVVDGMKRVGDQWEPTDESEDENDLVATRIHLAEKWIADRRSDATSPAPGTIVADAFELAGLLKQYGHELLRSAAAPRFCPDCSAMLKFDPTIVGDTVGGLTLRGWDVCMSVLCGKAWLSERAIPAAGEWKLASGGRSVETGQGRIRVDGGTDVETLMARILKLPELELEIARLRDYRSEQEALVLDPEVAPETPRGETSPWRECKLVVNGTELRDGDRILKINQPEAKDNGVFIIRLERP